MAVASAVVQLTPSVWLLGVFKLTVKTAFVVPLLRGTYRTRLDFEHPSKDSAIRFRVYRCKDGDAEWWKNELYRLSGDEPGR